MKNATITTLLPELNPAQIKLLHRALLEYVIGEDDKPIIEYLDAHGIRHNFTKKTYEQMSVIRNQLRGSQRAALQAFLGLSNDN